MRHHYADQPISRVHAMAFDLDELQTRRSSRLRHLKQTGPGVLSGRSKSDAWVTTEVMKSAILRAGPFLGSIAALVRLHRNLPNVKKPTQDLQMSLL